MYDFGSFAILSLSRLLDSILEPLGLPLGSLLAPKMAENSRGIPLGIYAAIFIAALITILSLPFFSLISDFAMAAANILLS